MPLYKSGETLIDLFKLWENDIDVLVVWHNAKKNWRCKKCFIADYNILSMSIGNKNTN